MVCDFDSEVVEEVINCFVCLIFRSFADISVWIFERCFSLCRHVVLVGFVLLDYFVWYYGLFRDGDFVIFVRPFD